MSHHANHGLMRATHSKPVNSSYVTVRFARQRSQEMSLMAVSYAAPGLPADKPCQGHHLRCSMAMASALADSMEAVRVAMTLWERCCSSSSSLRSWWLAAASALHCSCSCWVCASSSAMLASAYVAQGPSDMFSRGAAGEAVAKQVQSAAVRCGLA